MDYKSLNKIIKNCLALLLINKTLNYLIGFKIFAKLDLKNIYYYIYIWHNNKWKMAFRTRYDYFKYLVILFRLTNALITF